MYLFIFQDGVLLRFREDNQYTCGDALPVECGIFVRESLTCISDVEINYYSSTMRHFVPPCCFYCGDTENLIEDVDEYIQNLLEHFSVVRPICINCSRRQGKEAKTSGKRFFSKKTENINTCDCSNVSLKCVC